MYFGALHIERTPMHSSNVIGWRPTIFVGVKQLNGINGGRTQRQNQSIAHAEKAKAAANVSIQVTASHTSR